MVSLDLYYIKLDNYRLVGYSNNDWHKWSKKHIRICIFHGPNDVHLVFKEALIVILWKCEVEYIVTSWCVCHEMWLKNILSKLEMKHEGGMVIQVDNKWVIKLTNNSSIMKEEKTCIWFHMRICERKKCGACIHEKRSRDQVASLYAKPLSTMLFNNCKNLIRIK